MFHRTLVFAVAWCSLWAFPRPAAAQSLRVYSEFHRIDPFGRAVAADRAADPSARPREILSPGVARNAFASYHVAVTLPSGGEFTLYAGQNPENSFRVTIYKEIFARIGDSWYPDRLEPVALPYTARLPDPVQRIPGQTTAVFWMDVWVPLETAVSRIKLELQMFADGDWLSYPMEVRVLPATVPEPPPAQSPVAAVQLSADSTARAALVCYLCGCDQQSSLAPASLRRLILRNALQDVALAKSLEELGMRSFFLRFVLGMTNAADRESWCRSPAFPLHQGAEWYLRVRDGMYRMVH